MLAAMSSGPCYGYAVAARIKAAADDSCSLTVSAIYHALRRLHEQGHLAAIQPEAGQPRQLTKRRWDDRRWYRLTPQGRLACSQWVSDPRPILDIRAKLESAARRGAAALRDALDRCEALCDTRERMLATVQALCAEPICDLAVIARQRSHLSQLREQMQNARIHIGARNPRQMPGCAAQPWPAQRPLRLAGHGRSQPAAMRGG